MMSPAVRGYHYAKGQFKIDKDRLGKFLLVVRFEENHVK